MVKYINKDGLVENFGAPTDFQGGTLKTQGARKEVVLKIDGVKVTPATGAHQDNEVFIPAGAVIESSKTIVTEAFAGGTNITLGYENKAGTAIDADGIDAAVATGALTLGAVIVNDGALATNVGIGAVNAYPALTKSGTFTAGKADVVITYIDVN